MSTHFHSRHGFERADVTIANWRLAPYSRWSFQNLREIVPTAEIRCGTEQPEQALEPVDLLDASLDGALAGKPTVRAYLDHAHTDAFVMMKSGRIVAEHYAAHGDVNARHLVFSISKSLTALIAGVLEGQGLFNPTLPVTHYLPEAKDSVYGDCTCRDVLDMRVSLDFEEAYLDRMGAFARYRRATLWNPPEPDTPTETLADFLLTLKKAERAHGGRFYYASPNSDMLGILLERATGRRYAELFSELLWQPLGAKNHALVSVDSAGTARSAGGVCVTARDLARVGQMLLDNGQVDGRQVVPAAWVADMRDNGSTEAWAESAPTFLPNGRYRSKWYQSGEADGAFCAIGIHGQWLYVDPSAETVIVKLSSQPNPLDDELKHDNFAFFRALCRSGAQDAS